MLFVRTHPVKILVRQVVIVITILEIPEFHLHLGQPIISREAGIVGQPE